MKPVFHQNLDLDNIVTPVKVDVLTKLLRKTFYPESEILFLEHGFRNGFNIGYEGPMNRQSQSHNLPLWVGNEIILWNKLMKEVDLGCVARPFEQIPFAQYIQSPIGLVPKSGKDETRLIFHLSYDFKEGGKSVNHHTPWERATVQYRDLDFAVKLCLMARKDSTKPLYMGKTDAKSAFRILLLSKWSWQWVVMKARHPLTKKWVFFVDKCLPFGASISCAHF